MITLHANLSYLYVISVLHSFLYTSVSDYIPWVERALCIGQANQACMHNLQLSKNTYGLLMIIGQLVSWSA